MAETALLYAMASDKMAGGGVRGLFGGQPALLIRAVGLASPSKRGWISPRVYMRKPSPPTRIGSLSRVTFIIPRNLESDICVQVFIL